MRDDVPAEQSGVPEEQDRTPITHTVMRVVAAGAGFLFIAFAVVNRQPVEFSWVFGESARTVTPGGELSGGIPLILLLLAAFGLGAATGIAVAWLLRRRRRGDD